MHSHCLCGKEQGWTRSFKLPSNVDMERKWIAHFLKVCLQAQLSGGYYFPEDSESLATAPTSTSTTTSTSFVSKFNMLLIDAPSLINHIQKCIQIILKVISLVGDAHQAQFLLWMMVTCCCCTLWTFIFFLLLSFLIIWSIAPIGSMLIMFCLFRCPNTGHCFSAHRVDNSMRLARRIKLAMGQLFFFFFHRLTVQTVWTLLSFFYE